MDKLLYIHVVGYYTMNKMNKPQLREITQMNLQHNAKQKKLNLKDYLL